MQQQQQQQQIKSIQMIIEKERKFKIKKKNMPHLQSSWLLLLNETKLLQKQNQKNKRLLNELNRQRM